MERKNERKISFGVVLITIEIITLLLMLLLTSCSSNEAQAAQNSMFEVVENDTYYKIVYHKESKVMYALSIGNNNCGNLTVLVDSDGTPLLYED